MRLLLSTKVACATGGEYLSHELFEKGASSMGPNDWILIVDDEKTRRHELSIILEFLGESITGTDSATWQKAAEEAGPADCVAVFLGSCGTLEVLTEQLQGLKTWKSELPVVLIGEAPVGMQELSPELSRMVIATLSIPPRDRKSTRLNSSHVAISYAV